MTRYNQGAPNMARRGEPQRRALALNDIGRVFADLGQHQKALEYFNQACRFGARLGTAVAKR